MRLSRILIGCCACAVIGLSAAGAQAAWPWQKKEPKSVLVPPEPPTWRFSSPAPYPYGWFDARYRPRRFDQHGFYGDYWQHGYWFGYR